MTHQKWTFLWLSIIPFSLLSVGIFNYIIDPYGSHSVVHGNKNSQIFLTKIFQVKKIRPRSIILGTSRAEFGYSPKHPFFLQPSYNFGTSQSSVYEDKIKLNYAIQQGRLKQVLYVADYGSFILPRQSYIHDFESLFDINKRYTHLFNYTTFKDSLLSVFLPTEKSYFNAGQRNQTVYQNHIMKKGGHHKVIQQMQQTYYQYYDHNYTYADTARNSIDDLKEIIHACYQNHIQLDIIFGPSHVMQWQALDKYIGFDKWLQWKENIVDSTYEISKLYSRLPYRIIDFSVYHPLTTETIPNDKNKIMFYHFESSHYKYTLGKIVLDILGNYSKIKDFGFTLNKENIQDHQKLQKRKFQYFLSPL